MTRTLLMFAGLAAMTSVAAEVTDSAPNGFSVRHEIATSAKPDALWGALTDEVAQWWHPDHTYSGDAANLTLDATALGCFCEATGNGGNVVHLTVTFVQPGETLRLTGGLGPLGLMGVDGNMTISILRGAEATVLQLVYSVGGYSPQGFANIAPAVDRVLGEQMERLAAYAETGSATR